MTRSRLLWIPIFGGILAVGVGAYRLGQAREPVPIQPRSAERAAHASEDERLRALERQVSLLRSERRRAQAPTLDREGAPAEGESVAGAGAPEALTEEERRERDEEEKRRAEAARAEMLQKFSDRVDTEARDPAWMRETEAKVRELFPRELGAGVRLGEVTCASTACRVTMDHPESDRLPQERVTRLLMRLGSLGRMEVHLDVAHEEKTTMYMIRQQPRPGAPE